jgi:hypothetical protein
MNCWVRAGDGAPVPEEKVTELPAGNLSVDRERLVTTRLKKARDRLNGDGLRKVVGNSRCLWNRVAGHRDGDTTWRLR